MSITASQKGLCVEDVARRLSEYGPNEISREKSRPPWLLFLQQFKSPLVIILILACLLSLILGEHIEAVAIGSILLINALIGFFQENRAETAITALQKITAPRARVSRGGHQMLILARDVVPDDILILESGDIVAADAEILDASHLQTNEAVLTGESLPVRKTSASDPQQGPSAGNSGKVFMGTSVVGGTGLAKVVATGMKTELGRIAHLISTARSEPTPLQVQLSRLGKTLLGICLIVVLFVAVVGFMQGRSWLDLLVFSLSLAVAAVPEGMPAIVTVALALGVQRLAVRSALIRKLPSVETLGSVSVICTDKTGTLTTGDMRVREIWGEDHVEVLRAAASCCDAELEADKLSGTGDPTELAILIAAHQRGIKREAIEETNPRVSTEPFDPLRRRMSILRRDDMNYFKGAPENIIPLCRQQQEGFDHATKAVADMAARGLRVLAVATGRGLGERNLNLLGLLAIADPPRTEATEAIKEARGAGIIPIMITGDNPRTAAAIARELGLVLGGESLEGRVHARATPEDKLNLVRKWKKEGHIVAMTGDGVNDAPALREAHIGIAMGKAGTEVTRQAADLILADDNFATIVAAVREGRSIFQNIRRAVTYLLTGNLAEIAIVLAAIIADLPLPLLATHLLWINLVTDALPALTLIAEPLSPSIMKKGPRSSKENLIGRPEWNQIIWVGLLEASLFFGLYRHLLGDFGEDRARGILFTGLIFSQLLRSFAARSKTRIFWEVGAFSNLWLLAVVLISIFLQIGLHHIPLTQEIFGLMPLSWDDYLMIMTFSLVPVTVIELGKLLLRLKARYMARALHRDNLNRSS